MAEGMINFDLSEDRPNIIKVIGVGGGGGNAVRYMAQKGIVDVDFVVCNTDKQVTQKDNLNIEYIQIGEECTNGYGAGNDPNIGKEAAEESIEQIKRVLSGDTKMVFITAAMGGGTGTGAAPIIAKTAKDMGRLVVGVVTVPARFEGPIRVNNAKAGVEAMESVVDCLIVIENDRIKRIHKNSTLSHAFSQANEVLLTAAKGIAEIITLSGYINVDFADVKTVMENSGVAIMGAAKAEGEDRAITAIKDALESPLLSNDILGAKNILFNITSGEDEVRTDELLKITRYIIQKVGDKASVIWGVGRDMSLGKALSITVIATGYPKGLFNIANNGNERKPITVELNYVTLTPNLSETERLSLINEPAYKRRGQILRVTHGD